MGLETSVRKLIRRIEAQGAVVTVRGTHYHVHLASGQLVAVLPKGGTQHGERGKHDRAIRSQLRRVGFDV